MFKGIHYRNQWFYYAQNIVKLGRDHDLRFKIAAQYVSPGDSVLDVCAGPGQLQRYLPDGCRYTAVEASPQFNAVLSRKGIPATATNLHNGIAGHDFKADVVIMIVSLCHFRNSSMADLLESFKKISRRVVIVEDVLEKPRKERALIQKAMDYLCSTEYYFPVESFTAEEFQRAMRVHGYACTQHSQRYWVARYEQALQPR